MTRTTRSGRIAASIAVATAILVAAPVISIIALAMQPAPDVWQTLIKYVLPRSLLDTALLLGGVGALSLLIGTGTAWTISLHEFPGRRILLWLVPLPLAIPTYLAAYVYVDLFEPLGLVQRTLAVWFPLQDAVRMLPSLRSLPGAIIVIARPIGWLASPLPLAGVETSEARSEVDALEERGGWGLSPIEDYQRGGTPPRPLPQAGEGAERPVAGSTNTKLRKQPHAK